MGALGALHLYHLTHESVGFMTASTAQRWPTVLRLLKGRRHLHVRFDDGLEATLPAHLLRVHSPSAEVQGHGKLGQVLASDKSDIHITAIERVGAYAVRLIFSDEHSSGFYSWPFLEDFALNLDEKRAAYEAAMTRVAGTSSEQGGKNEDIQAR